MFFLDKFRKSKKEVIKNDIREKSESNKLVNNSNDIEKRDIIKSKKGDDSKYYLNLAINQKQQAIKDKDINKFVDDITKDYNSNYRYALYSLLKESIIEGRNDKETILTILNNMYKNNEIQKLINKSLLNKQLLGRFVNLNEDERREIINNFVQNLNNKNFNINSLNNYNDSNINKLMKNEKYTFIKYNYNNEKKRLLYIYENGTIIGINVKNEICELSERKIGKKKVDFIKRIINNDNLKVSEDHNTIIVNEDSNINEYDSGVFYLILMLINEKGVYNDKIFFKYDLYFSSEFDYAVKSLKYEEKIEKFIFVNWCPAEIEGNKIINVCRKIINNISINLKECNLTDLKYFADYYMLIKDYNNALIFYSELVSSGVELANLKLASCYNKIGNEEKSKECYKKAKDTIVPIFKKLTEKKCYKIEIENSSKPEILDSKINGFPYLPIGEEYPVSRDGKAMSLIMQINFKDVKLEDYPQEGILEVFADVMDIRNSEFEIRYYSDASLEYQTKFPKIEVSHFCGLRESRKLKLEEHYTWMPMANRKFDATLKRIVRLYNKKIDMNLYKDTEDDIEHEHIYELFYKENPYPFLLGGYADYAIAELTSDGWECEERKKESLIKLVDEETSCCLNIVISKKDLVDRKFNKAEVFYMD